MDTGVSMSVCTDAEPGGRQVLREQLCQLSVEPTYIYMRVPTASMHPENNVASRG
jgi:hypothetical protein